MKCEIKPATPPEYDPYEECCVGSHEGEVAEIVLDEYDNRLKMTIQEMKSGIGPSFNLSFATPYEKRERVISVFVDDFGVLNILMKGKDIKSCTFSKDAVILEGGD